VSEFLHAGSAVARKGVGKQEELAHHGGDGELGRLSDPDQGLVLGLPVGAGRHKRWHVESLAQAGTAAADEAPAFELA
jgi:hypothetical protein